MTMSYWHATRDALGRGLSENKSVTLTRISKCIVITNNKFNWKLPLVEICMLFTRKYNHTDILEHGIISDKLSLWKKDKNKHVVLNFCKAIYPYTKVRYLFLWGVFMDVGIDIK